VGQDPADPANTGAAAGVGQVYRLRVVLSGISPMIWRQLDVACSSTLADLHDVLQASFGWRESETFWGRRALGTSRTGRPGHRIDQLLTVEQPRNPRARWSSPLLTRLNPASPKMFRSPRTPTFVRETHGC
jgi:Plasmid pRiA4b ORF-3-like protein